MKQLLLITAGSLCSRFLISRLAPSVSAAAPLPVLGFSTYLGAGKDDTGNAIAVDAAGHVYVAGTTTSPALLGAQPLPGVIGGGVDVFVVKLDPTGANVLYLVYFGGSGDD